MHFTANMISCFNANAVNRICFKKNFCSGIQNCIKGNITQNILCLCSFIPVFICSIVLREYLTQILQLYILFIKKLYAPHLYFEKILLK